MDQTLSCPLRPTLAEFFQKCCGLCSQKRLNSAWLADIEHSPIWHWDVNTGCKISPILVCILFQIFASITFFFYQYVAQKPACYVVQCPSLVAETQVLKRHSQLGEAAVGGRGPCCCEPLTKLGFETVIWQFQSLSY